MLQTANRSLWLYAVLIFLGAALLYRLCLPAEYSGDDLQYTMVIERGAQGDLFYHPAGGQPYIPQAEAAALEPVPSPPPLNPRYLLEWPTSVLVARLWGAFGWEGSAIVPIQAYRIIVGALGLVFFFFAINRLVSNKTLALLTTIGLGVGSAYFNYSTHQDQSINMLTLLCLAFYLLVRGSQDGLTLRGKIILAAVLAGASFYNFTAALSALAFAVGVALLSADKTLIGRLKQFVTFGVIYGLIVVVVIAGAVVLFVSPDSLFDPAYWRSVTFGGKPEYNVSILGDAARAAIALAKSQTVFPGVAGEFSAYFETATTVQKALLVGFFGIELVILLLPFALLVIRNRKLGEKGTLCLFLVIWLAAHSLFNWFWDPGFNKYWLVPLAACWAAAALAIDHIKNQLPRFYRPAIIGASAFVAVSFLLNLTTQFLPQSRPADNPWLNIAQAMNTESQPADLFISPGHPMDFYVAYFSRRDMLSTGLVTYDKGGDSSSVEDLLAPRIEAHRADGGKVYIFGLETLSPEERAAFDVFIGDGELQESWTYPNTTIYEFVPA